MIRKLLALALAGVSLTATGQQWPTKPVRFVVPFAPGGTSEIVARAVAQELSTALGQTVFVENKPGGAGVIAMTEVSKADPDGHTIILGHVGTLAVNPYAMPKHPYDVNKEFAPVILLARVPNVLAVAPDVPAKTLKEFVALAKAKPDSITYGSAGNGSSGHLAMEMLKQSAGIDTLHVPYKGGAAAITDVIGGQIPLLFINQDNALPQVQAGKLRALAVASVERNPVYPDVPTVAESGYPGFSAVSWFGLSAPAGTPKEVIAKLHEATVKAMNMPEVKTRLQSVGFVVVANSPAQFSDFVNSEIAKWGKAAKASGATLD
mgnify:CR=1 FL=1